MSEEQSSSRIFRIEAGEFSHYFLGFFVLEMRNDDLDSHNLITPCSLVRSRRNTTVAKTQLLTVLSRGRNFELRASIDCRHFDLCAQGSLGHGDRAQSGEYRRVNA